MKKVVIILVSMLAVVGIIIGGWKVKQQVEYNQMVEIVQSEEVAELIKKEFQYYDPHAFTEKGKVKSYDIKLDTIERNPMGGIMFDIIINKDRALNCSVDIDKYGSDNELEIGGVSYSSNLFNLLKIGE